MQLAARPGVKHQGAGAETHVQGPSSSTHLQRGGGGGGAHVVQGRRQDSGAAALTSGHPEVMDLGGIGRATMELVAGPTFEYSHHILSNLLDYSI